MLRLLLPESSACLTGKLTEIPNGFDLDQWLQDWLQRPQPALGGTRPVNLLNTQEGIEAIRRVLGAVMSGAYQ